MAAATNPLDELRRRIGHGTTPVAFAALAEEHRRAGRLDEAVAVCREGLERYPTYASARVTLGRALLDLGDVQSAFVELEEAVAQAPDNLAAARALDVARARLADAPETPTADPSVGGSTDAPATMTAWLTNDSSVPEAAEAGGEAPQPELHVDDPAPDEQVSPDALAWLVAGADASVDDVADASFASEVPGADDELAPFDWIAPAPTGAGLAPVSWGVSVEEAVADVFASASGETDARITADAEAPAERTLDALHTMLEDIRARRALLSGTHSGVD